MDERSRRRDDRLPKRQPTVVGRHLAVRDDAKSMSLESLDNLFEQDAVLKYTA